MKPNSKQFWKTVRLLKDCNKMIPILIVCDQEITSDSEKVEVLCNHFAKFPIPPLSPADVYSQLK